LQRVSHCPDPLFGSTGSRLLDGTTPHHTALERRLADLFSYKNAFEDTSALLFNSGYDANVSFFSTIPQRGDYIVYDELVHASVWDGMRANSRRGVPETNRLSFVHNSKEDLGTKLDRIIEIESKSERPEQGMIYIAMESLYSMDGDLSPLREFVDLLERLRKRYPQIINPSRVIVILDEAHTTGVRGSRGRGLAWDLDDQAMTGDSPAHSIIREWVQLRLMTFCKAVGSQGGM
jgi:8-amino-7-oxononanoate synthase